MSWIFDLIADLLLRALMYILTGIAVVLIFTGLLLYVPGAYLYEFIAGKQWL